MRSELLREDLLEGHMEDIGKNVPAVLLTPLLRLVVLNFFLLVAILLLLYFLFHCRKVAWAGIRKRRPFLEELLLMRNNWKRGSVAVGGVRQVRLYALIYCMALICVVPFFGGALAVIIQIKVVEIRIRIL
jgi:hypothetical protein